MRPLQVFESAIAKQLGMPSGKDLDEVAVLHKVKALRKDGHLANLKILHHLRLQYNRTRDKLPAKLQVYPFLPGSPCPIDGSRFYAIFIGVNEYASDPLQGCISDVRLMEQYLTENLGVPRNRIQVLLGSKEHTSGGCSMYPSRANIVDALLSMISNPEILYGDNIVIFYSGHGSSYAFEREGDGIKFIEALCPIDRDTLGDDGKPVADISDREFNAILTQISRVKGDCITVILDCCHSGGATRAAEARRFSPTRHMSVQGMLRAGEKILKGYPDYRSILSNDWAPDMGSHVVLAACEAHQLAMSKMVERKDGAEEYIGIFTDSLVRALQSECSRETTYADLVRHLVIPPHQTPVVAGKRKDACLWYQE
ncbi:caspase domain-containing protein [Armillaria mellea]|nr:caspase domain-containing protein [Armillaria mellea]